MADKQTPDEVAARRDELKKIGDQIDPNSEIWRAMQAGAQMVADAFALGSREPSDKAERIRESIQVVRELDCEFSASGQGGRFPRDGYDSGMVSNFRMHVRYLLNALEQDDPHV